MAETSSSAVSTSGRLLSTRSPVITITSGSHALILRTSFFCSLPNDLLCKSDICTIVHPLKLCGKSFFTISYSVIVRPLFCQYKNTTDRVKKSRQKHAFLFRPSTSLCDLSALDVKENFIIPPACSVFLFSVRTACLIRIQRLFLLPSADLPEAIQKPAPLPDALF